MMRNPAQRRIFYLIKRLFFKENAPQCINLQGEIKYIRRKELFLNC